MIGRPGSAPILGIDGTRVDDSDRLAAEPGDFVGVLVAPAGEADDEDLAGPEAAGFLEGLGQGVAGFEGRQDALVAARWRCRRRGPRRR